MLIGILKIIYSHIEKNLIATIISILREIINPGCLGCFISDNLVTNDMVI